MRINPIFYIIIFLLSNKIDRIIQYLKNSKRYSPNINPLYKK